jgi:hypothetical protein
VTQEGQLVIRKALLIFQLRGSKKHYRMYKAPWPHLFLQFLNNFWNNCSKIPLLFTNKFKFTPSTTKPKREQNFKFQLEIFYIHICPSPIILVRNHRYARFLKRAIDVAYIYSIRQIVWILRSSVLVFLVLCPSLQFWNKMPWII